MYYPLFFSTGFPDGGSRGEAICKPKNQRAISQGRKFTALPIKWIDNFSMRNFTNDQIFDDTLPVGDGRLEIGARVPLDRLQSAMEDWFRRKGYLGWVRGWSLKKGNRYLVFGAWQSPLRKVPSTKYQIPSTEYHVPSHLRRYFSIPHSSVPSAVTFITSTTLSSPLMLDAG